MKQEFVIPFRLPGLNEVVSANRHNRFSGAKLKRQTDEALIAVMIGARLKPVERLCVVMMRFVEPNRRRDVDNVESAKKFVLDAMVKAGVLHGDSPRWVRAVPSYTEYGDVARVIVEIEELGGDGDAENP